MSDKTDVSDMMDDWQDHGMSDEELNAHWQWCEEQIAAEFARVEKFRDDLIAPRDSKGASNATLPPGFQGSCKHPSPSRHVSRCLHDGDCANGPHHCVPTPEAHQPWATTQPCNNFQH